MSVAIKTFQSSSDLGLMKLLCLEFEDISHFHNNLSALLPDFYALAHRGIERSGCPYVRPSVISYEDVSLRPARIYKSHDLMTYISRSTYFGLWPDYQD